MAITFTNARQISDNNNAVIWNNQSSGQPVVLLSV